MSLELLTVLIMWCGYNEYTPVKEYQCRRQAIECVRKLKYASIDKLIDECLTK